MPRIKELTLTEVTVKRDDIVMRLEEVQPGLSIREMTEQSSCVVFRKGRMITFNEEVFCSTRSGMPKELKGAVQCEKLLLYLRKIKDATVVFQFSDKTLKVKGKKREFIEFPFRNEILLPLDQVELPDDWRPIHKEFGAAINIVQQSASTDQSESVANCIHIHPKFVEASDGKQVTRYRLKTGVDRAFLVRKDSVKFISQMNLIQITETERMMHFKSDTGLIVSARRYLDDYQDMTPHLKAEGSPIILPKQLAEAMERCELITATDKDNNFATVELSRNELTVTGISESGRYYKKFKGIKYRGQEMKFKVPPKLMVEILRRHTDCEITDNYRIKINGGKFVFMASLFKETKPKKEEE